MNEQQREELLDQIYKSSATVGGSIPETVMMDDESVALREFFFEVANRDELQKDDRERVESIIRFLKRERLRLIQLIRKNEVDYEYGKELVPRILKLERATNAFESLEEPGLEEQFRQQKIKSAQELVDLMRKFGKM